MKRTIFKAAAATVLAMTLCFNSLYMPIAGSNSTKSKEMIALKRYSTEDPILLKGNQVYIPKQTEAQHRQFRGVWVSTVFNLDFPSAKGLSAANYKKEYTKLLDNLEAMNMNAVIFQVRPKLDAFYSSKINPWSEFLTGTQGKKPNWDPLAWMINETHNRGMEFHAWFNPFRVTTSSDHKSTNKEILSTLAANNWARKNEGMVYKFDGKLHLNPGEPAVIKHVHDSVMEVVRNYNIDAVHFDDYFYPYRSVNSKEIWFAPEEEETFKKYGQAFSDVGDWRRSNVDHMISSISYSITTYNKQKGKSVQFGISPYGIWGHYDKHPEGSAEGVGSLTPVTSFASYDNLYADTRKWVKYDWIDYIIPQVYWTFAEKAAPYAEVTDWWSSVVKDTRCQLYIGHANYKYISNASKNVSWQNYEEVPNQLRFNSMYEEIKGSSFFSYRYLLKTANNKGSLTAEQQINNAFLDVLKGEFFGSPALPPAKPWLDHKATTDPKSLSAAAAKNGIKLSWKDDKANDSSYYLIYRGDADGSNKKVIKKLKRQAGKTDQSFVDTTASTKKSYAYSITAVDRAQNETAAAELTYTPKK